MGPLRVAIAISTLGSRPGLEVHALDVTLLLTELIGPMCIQILYSSTKRT